MKRGLLGASIAVLAFMSSCKKTDLNSSTSNTPGTDTSAASLANAIKDSALLFSKDIYLWYNQIPTTFNARSYTDPDAIMTAIRQYSNEPGFSQPVDRWSFGMKQKDWDNLSSGVSGDFGLGVFFMQEGDLRVKSVERASPAGLAGIHRGWRITAINGNNNLTTTNADFIIQNVFQSSSTSFTFQKPDNSSVTINLTAATYQEHPVILDSVYTAGSKKIGYFSFNSFLGDTTEIYNEFSRVFNKFAAANVNDVVVDLRYNGGGYVSVSQKLADYLVPVSGNGGLMM
ncbi:MAG TPA: S41 family peptidase, partial [Flavisolibacter sp.]|nr:S41 family peptidase [Flavisolibacter sp.]